MKVRASYLALPERLHGKNKKDRTHTLMIIIPDAILRRFLEAQDRLVFQASDLSLGTIASMVTRQAIDVNPSYQRRERWSTQKQSALIESFLLNVPVPPIYLSEDAFGRYSVVDGKQRITTIHAFMTNKLKLTTLESFTEIENLYFEDLPEDLRNALDVRPYLRVISILKQSDPTLKFEVFTRLNRGGEAMEPQELRNVAFRGPLNDLIYRLGENAFLREQLKIRDHKSAAYRLMNDAEMVLRFLTLAERWKNFSGDFRIEMDDYMIQNANCTEKHLKDLEAKFNHAIDTCEKIWGSVAFKRPSGEGWRDQMLTGMYDAEMVASSLLSKEQSASAIQRSALVVEGTRQLFQDPDFDAAVRQGTNTPSRIEYRINRVLSILG